MTKIKNIIAYPRDITITDEDYIIGSDGDTSDKKTKNYFFNDIRSYLLAGLAPEVGGTLKVTEITYTGVLTTPSEVANALNPIYNVLQYNIVILSVNGDKYLLGLQNISIGFTETPITDDDFITINANFKLGDGINLYKGTNESTGKEEHYALKSIGLSITKEMSGPNETGNILIEQISQTKLGNGIHVYKGFNSSSKLQEFYSISSPDHVVALVDNEIVISNPDSGDVEQYIVNNTYDGDEELGTVAQPFKDIPQALVAYVGSGTNILPENDGVQIKVQAGDIYNFTGNFVYKNLNILADGAIINSNPSSGNYLLDKDSIGDINSEIKITLINGARINSIKKLINNKGNTNALTGTPKSIEILGDGTGVIFNVPDSSVVSASTKSLFEVNPTSVAGYSSDSVLNIHDIVILSENAPIYTKGGNQTMVMNNCEIEYGTVVDADINIQTSPFNLLGGTTTEKGNTLTVYQVASSNINKIYRLSGASTILLQEDISIQGGMFEYVFSNETGANYSRLDINNLRVSNVVNTSFADSSVVWDNVLMRNSTLNICEIDYAKVKLTPSSANIINNQFVETLKEYSSKSNAIAGGLFSGCAFVNKKTITAGSFVVGEEYKILTIGTTDFTLIGASANTVGLYFIASGIGTGTGTANFYKRDIVI